MVRWRTGLEKKGQKRTISYLTTKLYVLLGVNDNLLLTVDRDNLRRAVGIAGVVDKTTKTDR